MRVLLVTGEYPPDEGGVADYTRCLAEALAERGVAVDVATAGPATEVDVTGPRIVVHRAVADWGWGALPALARLARACHADIVHVQYQAAAYGMRPAIHAVPWWLSRRAGVRTAVTYHDLRVPYLFPKAGPLRRAAVRALARWSDLALVTNAADHADLAAWGGARRLALVPIGSNVPDAPPADYDRQAWRLGAGIGPATDLIAYFGFLNASKGALTLVEALGALLAGGHDARLVMIGGLVGASDPTNRAYLDRFRADLALRGLAERVVWTGHVPRSAVSAWLHAADAVALPYADGASCRRGSLLAALEHGAPIVTTAPEGTPAPLVDGVSARLVPADDPPAFAAALAEVLDDDDLRGRLAAGARSLAQAFAWPAIAARHVAGYREIAGAAGHRPDVAR
jgi:glycosyltransferase involved in cell wall biosynthesis